jgi:hypothetical protein
MTAGGTVAADTATNRAAASAARRVIFNMSSPDRVVQSEIWQVIRGDRTPHAT